MPGTAVVTINENQWNVEVASTTTELITGLSGRTSIPAGTGMLFILPAAQVVTVDTTQMLFPIDIIFIKDGAVFSIAQNIEPGYLVEEATAIDMFLEVNTDEADLVEVGDIVTIEMVPTEGFDISDILAFVIPLAVLGFIFGISGISGSGSSSSGSSEVRQSLKGSYYWEITDIDTGEIIQKGKPYSTKIRAMGAAESYQKGRTGKDKEHSIVIRVFDTPNMDEWGRTVKPVLEIGMHHGALTDIGKTPLQKEALNRLSPYTITEIHSDGDLTITSGGKKYVITTEGGVFAEEDIIHLGETMVEIPLGLRPMTLKQRTELVAMYGENIVKQAEGECAGKGYGAISIKCEEIYTTKGHQSIRRQADWIYVKVGDTEMRGRPTPGGIEFEQVSPSYDRSDLDKAVEIITQEIKGIGEQSIHDEPPYTWQVINHAVGEKHESTVSYKDRTYTLSVAYNFIEDELKIGHPLPTEKGYEIKIIDNKGEVVYFEWYIPSWMKSSSIHGEPRRRLVKEYGRLDWLETVNLTEKDWEKHKYISIKEIYSRYVFPYIPEELQPSRKDWLETVNLTEEDWGKHQYISVRGIYEQYVFPYIEKKLAASQHSIHGEPRRRLVKEYGSWAVGRAEAICPENDITCVTREAKRLIETLRSRYGEEAMTYIEVTNPGKSVFQVGDTISLVAFEKENKRLRDIGEREATGEVTGA